MGGERGERNVEMRGIVKKKCHGEGDREISDVDKIKKGRISDEEETEEVKLTSKRGRG